MKLFKKIPRWGWFAIASAAIVGVIIYQRRQQAKAAADAAAAQAQADTQTNDGSYQPQGQPLYPLGPVGGSPGIFMPPFDSADAHPPTHVEVNLPATGGGPPHRHHHHHHHPNHHHHQRNRRSLKDQTHGNAIGPRQH